MKYTKINRAVWRKWYVKYGFYVLPVVILTVVTLLTMVVLIPGLKSGLESNSKLKAEKAKVTQLTEKLAGLAALEERSLAARVQVTEQALPSVKDVGGVLVGMKLTAQRSGVSLLGAKTSPHALDTRELQTKGHF